MTTSDPKEALERQVEKAKQMLIMAPHYTGTAAFCGKVFDALIAKQEGLEREVARLTRQSSQFQEWYSQANSERNAAESKLSALSEACRPFIAAAEQVHEAYADDVWLWQRGERTNLTVGDLRALRRALLDRAVPVEPAQRTETITRVHLPSDVASIPDAYVDVRSPVPPSQGGITARRAPLVNAMKANLGIGQYDCESEIVGFVDAADAILALGAAQPHPDVTGLAEALEKIAAAVRLTEGEWSNAPRMRFKALLKLVSEDALGALTAFQSRQEEGT